MTNLAPETDLDSLTNQKKSKASLPGRDLKVVAAIVMVFGVLIGLSPFALLLRYPEAGMYISIFMGKTLPIGALEITIGIAVLIVGLQRSSRAKTAAPEESDPKVNARSVARLNRARLLIFIASPALILASPVASLIIEFIVMSATQPSLLGYQVTYMTWPLLAATVLTVGLVLTVTAKARPAAAIPLYLAAVALLVLTILGFVSSSRGIL